MSNTKRGHRPSRGWLLLVAAPLALLVADRVTWTQDEPSVLSVKMQALTQVLERLLSVLVRTDVPATADIATLCTASEQFAALAHTIAPADATQPASGVDPTLAIFSASLVSQAQQAVVAAKAEQYDAARAILRSTIEQCVACHTRSKDGSNHSAFTPSPPPPSLGLTERADYFAATRQFDRALKIYLGLVRDPDLAAHQVLSWQRAVRRGLDVAVGVQSDPQRAAELLDAALAIPGAPPFLVERFKTWRKTITTWSAERRDAPRDAARWLASARKQLDAALAQQQFPMDHDADVLFLRASASAHSALAAGATATAAAEALRIGGMAHELLADPGQAFLPEQYYEACIRQAPHTNEARRCLKRYESRVYFLHSGSGGASLQEGTERSLATLRDLAR
ncbi:MAG: hypothetical protein U0V87_02630 [Acidobacteriota bacterium]